MLHRGRRASKEEEFSQILFVAQEKLSKNLLFAPLHLKADFTLPLIPPFAVRLSSVPRRGRRAAKQDQEPVTLIFNPSSQGLPRKTQMIQTQTIEKLKSFHTNYSTRRTFYASVSRFGIRGVGCGVCRCIRGYGNKRARSGFNKCALSGLVLAFRI